MFDKLAVILMSPLGTSLMLGSLAIVLGSLRWRRFALGLGAVAVAWLWLWSTPIVSHSLRAAIESQHPPIAAHQQQTADAIVLLGGAVRVASHPQEQIDFNQAIDRVFHAARLYRAGKSPLIVPSGGITDPGQQIPEAQAMADLLEELGVPKTALLLEATSINTRTNATEVAILLRERQAKRVLLVTSALHMPRARRLFEAQGLEVIPAATDHEARRRFTPRDCLPSADALYGSARLIKEWVGRNVGA
jgi:uncharacterized SAM-binding protein YcdF (DUF218 family)